MMVMMMIVIVTIIMTVRVPTKMATFKGKLLERLSISWSDFLRFMAAES
jgi:hypothetical protein